MRGIQKSFPRLKSNDLPAKDHTKRHLIIRTCLLLFNYKTETSKVNRIFNFYEFPDIIPLFWKNSKIY